MTLEDRVTKLEKQFNAFNNAFLQAQKNNVGTVAKVDDTANKVEVITPYTDTKQAYYGDTSVTFYDAPQGNVSVFIDGYNGYYSVDRNEGRLVVSFDALEKQTTVSISIQ